MLLLAAVGVLTGTAPASAQPNPASTPTTVTWTDSAGQAFGARALTAAEIRAAGLDKYVDMSRLAVTTPRLSKAGAAGAPAEKAQATAVKRPSGTVSPMASGCWSHWFGYGTFSGPQLWGKTDVTWCGDGSWVTYSTSNCYGYADYPTYQYMGCNNYPNYGAGWNLYQVKTQWTLCDVWVPIWGSCADAYYPWEQYQYVGNGQILWNGGTT